LAGRKGQLFGRYSWTAADRRSAIVMTFAVSGCFRDGVTRVSWEVKSDGKVSRRRGQAIFPATIRH
jgi:hypothetical protein